MAKEPHWKCGKAKAPRVRVPCPLPVKKKASTNVDAVFLISITGGTGLEPGRARAQARQSGGLSGSERVKRPVE